MDIQKILLEMGKDAKKSAQILSRAQGKDISYALEILASLLRKNNAKLLEASQKDIEKAIEKNMSVHDRQRLQLTNEIIEEMAEACLYAAQYPHPINITEEQWQRPNGLTVGKMRVPLGVIAIIYESRPNVTIDAAILCLRAGNAVILRGGSEAIHANTALAELLSQALKEAKLPEKAVQIVPTTDREAVQIMCKLHEYIDVLIPRGGENLIRAVVEQATMPVLKHFKGVCHMYIEKSAKLLESLPLVINAKVQRPSACNALECLLIEESIAQEFLKLIVPALEKEGVEMRLCARSLTLVEALKLSSAKTIKAQQGDFGQEFHNLTLAIRIVDNYEEALEHISLYGSNHTECICTQNLDMARNFQKDVDASLVLVNASTRFNDGGQLGLGAEIGICTSKLHSYGVMGIKELTTTKYVASSEYLIRS